MSKLKQQVFMITTRISDHGAYSGHICTKDQSGSDKAKMFNKKRKRK